MTIGRKLDSLFEWADGMYSAGRFDEVDRVLARLNVSKLDDSLIYGWLCVSWWPEQAGEGARIPSRTLLHRRAAEHWAGRREDLLTTLRGPGTCKGFFTA